MASPQENVSMAVFCDFENVALGVRDAKIERFDIKPVLERLLLKGSIVVKKAYCDWERYKGFKASMHEASFELIEIPHVRQSGKNSADIRLVVDALDLCYTKSHVDTFVIVSGDSDFSPLVSKLRENAKKVIGVGVRHSTSDLLVANCDEFIFYDDLAREQPRAAAKRDGGAQAKRPAGEERQKADPDERKSKAIALAVETLDALVQERGDSGKIWASVLKSAIKRRRPDFSETRYGFRAFGNLLDEAQARGLLEVGRDEKSGAYVSRPSQPAGNADRPADTLPAEEDTSAPRAEASRRPRNEPRGGKNKGRREGRGETDTGAQATAATPGSAALAHDESHPHAAASAGDEAAPAAPVAAASQPNVAQQADNAASADTLQEPAASRPASRRARKTASRKSPASAASENAAEDASTAPAPDASPAPAAKKAPARARRTRSKTATNES